MLVVELAVGLRWKGLSQKTEKIVLVFPFVKRPLLRAKLYRPKSQPFVLSLHIRTSLVPYNKQYKTR